MFTCLSQVLLLISFQASLHPSCCACWLFITAGWQAKATVLPARGFCIPLVDVVLFWFWFFHLTCSQAVVMAPLTAVSPLNRETTTASSKQILYERNYKVYAEKRYTSKAGVEVPPELITGVRQGEGDTVAPERLRKHNLLSPCLFPMT